MRIYYIIKPLYCFIISAIFFLSANIALGQTLISDAPDYPPGATATLTGSGFQPGEYVEMAVHHADAIPDTGAEHGSWMIIADFEGSFVTTWHVCEDDCDGSLLEASADGQSSGLHAEVFFTDAACISPTITSQPVGGTRYVGESISFTVVVTANGGGILTFQWKKGGVNIPGAVTIGGTSSTYTIPSVSSNDAGSYTVAIVRAGCVTAANSSPLVILTVNNTGGGAVSDDQTICSGEIPASLTSTISGSGDGTITYQWKESIDNSTWTYINGATNAGYGAPAITNTSYFRRMTISTLNGVRDSAFSNVITITTIEAYNVTGAPVTACMSYILPWGTEVTSTNDYSHTYSSVNGCDSVVTINVIINPLPIVTTSNNGPLCTGGTLNLSSTGGSALPGLTPDFGTAANFILFTPVGAVSNTGVSQITGNIGSNIGAITGFETSIVIGSFHNVDSVTAQCSADLLAAYNVLNNTAPTNTSHAPAFGTGETLFAGVYSIAGAGSVGGNLTLDAQGNPNAVFIFKIGAAFTTGASTTINLTNGATAGNVFWVAEGAISMAAVTTMKGTLIANNGAISMGAGGSLEGRMFSTAGAVSVYAVTASIPINANSFTASYTWTGPDGFTSTLQNPTINDINSSASGIYAVTVTNEFGCSSVSSTSVVIHPPYNITLTPAISCVSYTLPWGQPVSATGNYSHTYSSLDGCDSTVTIHVTIHPDFNTTDAVSACVNYTLPWGVVATSTGDYNHTYSSINDCDSTVTIHVTINPAYNTTASPVAACVNYTLPWGVVATSTGDYNHTYSSINDCDSTVTIHVTIHPAYNTTGSPVAACVNYTLPWGVVATSTGDYSDTYSSINSCDSTVTIHVTINPAYNTTASPVAACVNYTLPWGVVATSTGDYSHTYSSINSCDSAVMIHVTINPAYNITGSPVSACVNYTLPWGVVATSSGDYSHTYSSVNGCDSTVTIPVTINQNPNPVITGNNLVCNGSGSSFDAGSGYSSYAWSTGATTQTISVNTAGTYTVTVTNSSGCTGSTSRELTMNANPVPTITGNNSICSGASSTIDAGAGYASYLWSTGATTQTISVNTAATYTVTVTNSYGCTGSTSRALTVNASPVPAITGNNSICSGAPTTITASAGYAGYMWSTGATTQSISVSTAGTYTVTVTNTSGCTGIATISVATHTNPTATASSNSPVVGGNTLNLTSGGALPTYGLVQMGLFLLSRIPAFPGITYLAAGTYTVVVTNSYGCTASKTVTVVTTCCGFKSFTYTQGGWGATPNGNNPAVYRNANFPNAFPTGLVVGCGSYWLTLTTSLAVQNFLPAGGTPAVLTQSYTDPGSSLKNTLAAQVTALALNIGFDNYDATFAPTALQLKNLYVKSGTFMGWTVLQVLTEAQKKLGGCSSTYTASQLSTACANINENYDNGTTDKGYLSCQPLRVANVLSVSGGNNLKLYPNPNSGVFVIELGLDEAVTTTVDIQVFNLLGQIMYVTKAEAIDGILREEMKLDNNLQNGNYLIRAISGEQVYTGQVIYQK